MSKNVMGLNQQVEDYVSTVKKESEVLVKDAIPKKIVALNTMMATHFSLKELSAVHQKLNIPYPDAQAITRAINNSNDNHAPTVGKKRKHESGDIHSEDGENDIGGTKVLCLPTGPVNCNLNITTLIEIVKPAIKELVEDANLLKMWVTFLIPKIEDGNNFGVSIQEDTLGEIRTVEAEAATFFEQISRYYLTRGKIVTKVAKYPHVEDYRRLIDELDEKEYVSLRIVLSEIRNHYAALYDLIAKNWEKIIRPRTSNAENLY